RQQGSLSVAGALLIFGCLAQMADALRRVSKLNVVLQKSNVAAERIFETIDLPSESQSPRSQRREGAKRDAKAAVSTPLPPGEVAAQRSGADGEGGRRTAPERGDDASGRQSALSASLRSAPLPGEEAMRPFSNDIVFDNIGFRYSPDLPPAIQGVSLTVRKGESVAIVGRNGSGKTTLLSLLPRFFDPDEGAIRIDGVDIRDVALQSLRRQIGVVTQEAVVFPGTIADNIAYAVPDATQEQVESAARQAEAHEFIMAKPQGYDTPLT